MAIATIHEDILKTHILTKLDGQTLAAAGCTSSGLQTLCSDHKLWSNICHATWPSTVDPLVNTTISTFTSGHRSFFSDAFSSPTRRLTATVSPPPPTTMIISSVDIKFHDQLIFSKVELTNTTPSDWFQTTPFRVDLLEPKELVLSGVKFSGAGAGDDHVTLTNLENNMTLSWIMIDPTRNRAVNLSSGKPVSVQRNWLTDDVELTFAVVLVRDNDDVTCNILVTCGVNDGRGELTVKGVSLTVMDVYGKCLSGRDSMVILRGLVTGLRQNRGSVEEERERYGEYIQRRRERKEKSERRERWLDMACVATGLAIFMAFCSLVIY
ncbi:F-box protein At2g27310-like [Bidens hawaiensis]|uniref:F-box protein At2g27310-like n=1 Tax=Bidens hawaiensis TaxID=980011 RepID=UPI00404A00B7